VLYKIRYIECVGNPSVHRCSCYLSEDKLEAFLRSPSFRLWNPLYDVARIVDSVDFQDGVLFATLKNGLKFCLPPDKEVNHFVDLSFKYSDPSRLGVIKDLKTFQSFLTLMHEQFIEDIYECSELKQNDVVVDLGAHMGGYAVKAAKAVGDEGRVIAVEPEPGNLSFLRRNIELNKLKNVTVVPKGVWSKKGYIKLYLSKQSLGHSIFPPDIHERFTGNCVEIEVDTLDNILGELKVKSIDFIKMDIECSEIEALKGMEETLKSGAKLAIGAYHPINGRPSHEILVPLLEQRGYNIRMTGNDLAYSTIIFAEKKRL